MHKHTLSPGKIPVGFQDRLVVMQSSKWDYIEDFCYSSIYLDTLHFIFCPSTANLSSRRIRIAISMVMPHGVCPCPVPQARARAPRKIPPHFPAQSVSEW